MREISVMTFEYRCRKVRCEMEEEFKQNELDAGLVLVKKSLETTDNTEPFFAKVELRNDHNIQESINIRSGILS